MSGVIGKAEIMDSVHIGGIGGTYSGNPLACVAALEVLNIMKSEKLPEKANEIGRVFRNKIDPITHKAPWIKEIRGLGAMMAIEIFNPNIFITINKVMITINSIKYLRLYLNIISG